MIIGIGGGPIFYLKDYLKIQDQVLIYKYKYIISRSAPSTHHCKPHRRSYCSNNHSSYFLYN